MQAIITTLLIIYSLHVVAAPSELNRAIQKQVESSRIKTDHLSLIIGNSMGDELYSLNAQRKVIPASLTKIVTAATILDKLPVGHQFVTDILVQTSKIKKGELNGALYLRGGGDAGFVSESMWFLVNEFLRSEIKTINGDIIVDDSRFDAVRFDSSRDQERVDRAYDAPVGAMTFNWSAVNVFVRPASAEGEPARVFADPQNDYFKIVNQTKTSKAGSKTEIEVSNVKDTLLIRGSIARGANEFVAYKSVSQPEQWAGQQLAQFLKQRNISFSGQIKSGVTPADAVVIASRKSKPIGEIVSDMMKYSNNYIAEILTKNLAFEVTRKQGTMSAGIDVIREHLKSIGLKDFTIENPSGLSRKNLFSVSSLLSVLAHVKSHFNIYPEYLMGLPIAGVDGTLKRRIKQDEFLGRVRAKTGHLTGVNGLGGFMSDRDGEAYPFVFIYNGPANDAFKSQELFDRIITEFLKAK